MDIECLLCETVAVGIDVLIDTQNPWDQQEKNTWQVHIQDSHRNKPRITDMAMNTVPECSTH